MRRPAGTWDETYTEQDSDGLGAAVFFTRRPVGRLRPGDHAWLAFGCDEERERVVSTFVTDGLVTEEKVVYVTDADPLHLPGVRWPADLDPPALVRSGRLRVLPQRKTCLADGRFAPQRLLEALEGEVSQAFDQGFRAVRITTDLTWAVEGETAQQVLGHEHRFGLAVSGGTMAMAICQVDRRRIPPQWLTTLRAAHDVLVEADPEFDDGVLRIVPTFDPPGLRVEGELDAARHMVFAERLALAVRGRRQVHLDCSRLLFLDPAGLGVLVEQAAGLPRGGVLVLDRLPADVAEMIETVGWARLPRLVPGQDGDR